MQTPTRPRPSNRRSREELRLEQIAIWGDAAYNTRQEERSRSSSGSSSAASIPEVVPSTSHKSQRSSAASLDLRALEHAVVAEGMQLPPPSDRGSFSMCHSRSADVFRRSGSRAAAARASLRDRADKKERRLPDVEIVDVPRVVLTKRSSMSITGREYWMDTVTRGRRGKKDDFEEDLFLQSRRESAVMRERDEDNFRRSNAVLPERLETDTSSSRRRCRASTTMLGRYTRSRSSQLPPRAHTKLRADKPVQRLS